LLKRSLPPDLVLDIPDARPAYDGSVASLVPYMIAQSLSLDDPNLPGGPGLPVSCDIIVQYPVLLDSTEPSFGSSSDNFLPQVDCDNSRFTPDNTVTGYADMLRSFSNLDRQCGGTEEYSQISRIAYENWIVNLLPAALLGTTRYDGTNGTYLRHKNGDLEKLIEAAPKDQHRVPLARWTYSGPDAYLQAAPLVHVFPAARAALAQRYETEFGFSPKDASTAAQIGVWVLDNADSWALDSGAPDPLAKAILTGAPVSAVKMILPATGTNSTLPPVYLADAVLNTAVIPLLLQAHANVNGVDDDGVTALMEAAMHDKPDAVKLLLAAGGGA
jgi:hypothetical protein